MYTETEHTEIEATEAGGPEAEAAPVTIDVRRNAPLAAVLGVGAGALAVAFGLRVIDGGALLDWILFGAMAVVAIVHLAGLLDSRAPLLVADDQGVRLREGSAWHGIGWRDVACLEHLPRRGVRDGHLLLVGPDQDQLVVPLTLATRVRGAGGTTLSDDLAQMAAGDADVVEVVPGLDGEADDDGPGAEEGLTRSGHGDGPETTTDIPRVRADSGVEVVTTETSGHGDAVPLADRGRRAVGAVSSLLHRALPHPPATDGATALHTDIDPQTETLPEIEELSRPEPEDEETHVFGVRVVDAPAPTTVTSTTQVLGDLQVEPVAEPVIGRELRSARERIRLTVDQLAERTRIRPHVLEAMEVDDFAACGGDFYARGHLRTISRVLGLESGPLVAAYDEKYADAPIDPKRVFESELATGAGGAIRGTRGGRNWSVLVAAVMAAVLVWSVAQLVMDRPEPVGDAPVLNQSGGITNQAPQAKAVPVTLTAVGGGAKLVVRDGGGDIVFDGRLAFGQSTQLDVAPPVRISSSDGSVTASVDGGEADALGDTGEDATKTIVP